MVAPPPPSTMPRLLVNAFNGATGAVSLRVAPSKVSLPAVLPEAPSLLSWLIESVPPMTEMGPVLVLVPLRTTVPPTGVVPSGRLMNSGSLKSRLPLNSTVPPAAAARL